jgi:glycosyltransferase involved in cell wall biosynthesis
VISVIVCTFNRDRMFEETVRSFLSCRTDGIEYELLLLDNNSTDKTREIGEGFAARFPRIRYINEPVQGHPHTKNRGVRESRGEIVAFLDDDVYLSPGWLTALASSFERHPDVACIGGRVVPHFEADRPKWLEDGMLIIYGITEFGENERVIRPPEVPIGCNMAFRRSVFEQLGDFPTSLGRKPGNLLSNDENYFLLRAAKAGLKTFYSPDAQVSHRIPPVRMTRNFVLKRWYWQGISEVAMKQIDEDPLSRGALVKQAIKTLFGLLRRWKDTARLLSAGSGTDGSVPIHKHIDICLRLGMLRQFVGESLAFPIRKKVNK